MPAAFTTGISTGVSSKMVGVMSSAVPTTIVNSMIASINNLGLSNKGCSNSTTCAGKLATVISQADTMAAATRNITTAQVMDADTNSGTSFLKFSSL